MTNTGEAVKTYTDLFTALKDAGSQCDYLITLGLQKNPAGSIKTDINRITGCKTAIWINVECTKKLIHFTSESDSLLVCGILAIYEALYNGKSPEYISGNPPEFLESISDEVIYPEIKQNGLLKCYKKLCAFQKINHNDKGEYV